VYRPHNLGHYALGADAYCHFTSPIRRYPDLLVHRALKMQLAHEKHGRKVADERAPRLVGTGSQAMANILPELCRQASTRERVADAAAHATQKVKVAQYYASRVGERAAGTVVWIDQMGMFVRLDDTGAEGLVRMKALGGNEWWDFDERRLMLVGSSTGTVIQLGQRVIIEVSGTNPVRGHVDFKLIQVLSV
jgi:exoribonuclease R